MNITSILPTINVASVSNQVSLVSGKSLAVVKSPISKKSSASTVSTSIIGVSPLILRFFSRPLVPSLPVKEASNLKQSETRNNYIPRFLRNKNNPHGSFFTSWRKREDEGMSLRSMRTWARILVSCRNKNNPVGSFLLPGGSERIRTSETLLPTRFRVVRLQPLGHASTSHSITPFS